MRSRTYTPAVVALALTLAAHARPSGAIDWPAESTPTTAADPINPIRWTHIPWWIDPSPSRTRAVLAGLSADDPHTLAFRAVALRTLNREDDARSTLARAVAASPDVLNDPDVALTGAYLAARTHDYVTAVDLARRALPWLDHAREMLVIEVAHWSMARGPEGIAPAIALLRDWMAFGVTVDFAPSPLVRATLALALARSTRPADVAEAVEIARSLRTQLDPHAGDREPVLGGATVLGEGRAAVGVCLVLAGDPASVRASIEPLAYAVTAVPAPWRSFQTAMLATAHRLAPEVTVPTEDLSTLTTVPVTAPTPTAVRRPR